MASDRQQLARMLGGAVALHDYQRLTVRSDESRVIIFTGPDDAVAVFGFDSDGRLKTVSVVESHPELEADANGAGT